MYSSHDRLTELAHENQPAFFRLAYAWPQFLKNTAIMQVMSTIKLVEQNPLEQCEALKVLTDKKILHPELINSYFRKIMPLSDRDQVKKYLG